MAIRHSKRAEVASTIGLLVGFVVLVSALGTSKFQRRSGGSWGHAFLVNLLWALALALPVGLVMVVAQRDVGDRMPSESWAMPLSPSTAEDRTYCVPRRHRRVTAIFFLVMLAAAPYVAVRAWRAGLSATIFVTLWAVVEIVVFRSWWWSSPISLTLRDGTLLIRMSGGIERELLIGAISEIRWRYWDASVTIRHDGGTLNVPKQVVRLDELLAELRRRNPAIRFDGRWPVNRA
jgi:hypothetical protein